MENKVIIISPTENEPYIGTEVKDLAIEKLEETNEGCKENGKKTRGRKKSTAV